MLSLLSDPFFFTGFPLSGIYNIPAEVERLIFTALSYQSYFKLKAQCCFHLEIFLHEPFTAFTSHGMPRPLRFLQFTARSLAGTKKAPPSHHPTQTPAGGHSHCYLWTIKLQVGRRKDWEAVEVGISFLCSRSLFPRTHSLASGDFFSLDGIDGRMNQYTH